MFVKTKMENSTQQAEDAHHLVDGYENLSVDLAHTDY